MRDDDTIKMGPSDGVPVEIIDDEQTWPYSLMVAPEVENSQIEEVEWIDQSDGVPLMSPGMADTQPSNPTTVRIRKSNPQLAN